MVADSRPPREGTHHPQSSPAPLLVPKAPLPPVTADARGPHARLLPPLTIRLRLQRGDAPLAPHQLRLRLAARPHVVQPQLVLGRAHKHLGAGAGGLHAYQVYQGGGRGL